MIGAVKLLIWSTLGQQIVGNNPPFPCVSMCHPNREKQDNCLKSPYPFKSQCALTFPRVGMMTIWPRWETDSYILDFGFWIAD